jgi:hypothetical protein
MSYKHSSVYSAKLEDYVLKIHGQGWCDMYIQLPNLNALNTWEQCFNQKKPDYLDFRRKPTQEQQEVLQSLDITHHPHDTLMLESSMSQDHLLRRMSDRSDEDITITSSSTTTQQQQQSTT